MHGVNLLIWKRKFKKKKKIFYIRFHKLLEERRLQFDELSDNAKEINSLMVGLHCFADGNLYYA